RAVTRFDHHKALTAKHIRGQVEHLGVVLGEQDLDHFGPPVFRASAGAVRVLRSEGRGFDQTAATHPITRRAYRTVLRRVCPLIEEEQSCYQGPLGITNPLQRTLALPLARPGL